MSIRTNRKRRLPSTENNDENEDISNQPATKRIRLHSNSDSKSNTNTIQVAGKEKDIFNGEDAYSFTAKQLKELCRKNNLKVGGNKSQLIARLSNPNQLSAKSRSTNTKKRITVKAVDTMLRNVGIEDPSKVNKCLKKGIQKQFYTISTEKDLDQIIYTDSCLWCKKPIQVSIRDCLYQDECGNDYSDGGEGGAIQCDGDGGDYYDECYGIYISELCNGSPRFTSGKFHNHCTECPGFGKCIGDYRESHCSNCGKHWFEGNSGFPCNNCNKRSEFGEMMHDAMNDFM